MNKEQKAEFIAYKMMRAKETLAEVELLIKNQLLHTAVNRIYYACFYAVSSLLVSYEIKAKKHSGVKQMFGLHFISKGKITLELGEFYSNILEMRNTGDYEDFIYFEEGEISSLIPPAQKLISRIEELLLENVTI